MNDAIVLGCSTGVGAEIAKRLAHVGRNIIGFHRGRHNAEAREVCKYINYETRADITLRTLDVGSSFDAVDQGVSVVLDQADQIDVVVHSLSGAAVGSVLDLSHVQIEQTFWNLAHSFLWWVRKLVNTDRLAPGCRFLALTNPCTGYYLRKSGVIGAAKSALDAYVKTLACELGPKGYRVNALSFGAIETPALAQVVVACGLADVTPPSGELQTAEDIAGLVVNLTTSPNLACLNGAIIDGTAGAPLMLMDRAFYGVK